MSVAAPIRWHVTKTDTLPTWFGLERRVLSLEEIISHQRSIQQLNAAFEGHRAYHQAEAQRREAYRPLPKREVIIDQSISVEQSTSGLGLNKKLYNFTETKRDDDDYKYSSSDLLDSPYKEMSPSFNQSLSRSVIVNNADTSFLLSNDFEPLDSKNQFSQKHSEFDPLYQSVSYEPIKSEATIIVPAAVINEDEQAHLGHPVDLSGSHSNHAIHTIQPIALPLDTSLIDDQSTTKSNEQLLVANEILVETEKATVIGTVEVDIPIAEPVYPHAVSTHESAMPLVDTALQLDEDNFAPPLARAHVEYGAADVFTHLGSAETVDEQDDTDSQPISAPQSSQVKSRTLQLAELHETLIAQERAAALGVDPATIKQSPLISMQSTPQSAQMEPLDLAPQTHVARMKHLHDAEIAAETQRKLHQDALFSGQLRHDVDSRGVAAPAAVSRVAEMKRLHDEEIAAEAQRKAHQDALFSGQLKHSAAPVAVTGMSSRIAEMKRLHEEAAIAEAAAKAKQDALFSGQLKHANSQQAAPAGSQPSSRIAEMKRLHEEAAIAEAAAKAKQDALFSGQLKHANSQNAAVQQPAARIAEMKRLHEESAQAEAAAKAKQDALFSGQLTLNQKAYERVVASNVVTIPLNDNAPVPVNSEPVHHEPVAQLPAAHIMNVDSTPMDLSESERVDQPVVVEPVQPAKKLRVSDMARLHDDEIAAEKERKAHQDALFSGQLRRDSGNSQSQSNEMASRIVEMKRLHEEAAIAEAQAKAHQDALFSGQLKRKSTDNISPARNQPSSRIAEMKHLHEQAAQDEADAKAKQDALFSGQLKHAHSEPRTSTSAMNDNVVHIPLNDEPIAAMTSTSSVEQTVQKQQGKSNRKKNRR